MIYVTGDVHGYYDFEKLPRFAAEHLELTRADCLIVAGDFGIWDVKAIKTELHRYDELPFTVLFVDGNHEHFATLDALPVEKWKGGKIHRLKENVIHLMRGQVFEIEGKRIFTFGGATSDDADNRIEGFDWFPQEVPCDADVVEANENLKRVKFEVDYVITHTCDEKTLYYPLMLKARKLCLHPENALLSYFEECVTYRHWYFGHFHFDADVTARKTVLYEKILPLL